jgi:hypothetical protein
VAELCLELMQAKKELAAAGNLTRLPDRRNRELTAPGAGCGMAAMEGAERSRW